VKEIYYSEELPFIMVHWSQWVACCVLELH